MGFLDEVYPESSEASEARHRVHFISWIDLALTLLFGVTVLLTLGEPNAWIALFEIPHIWLWVFGIGVADTGDASFVLSFGFTVFIFASMLDFLSILLRLFVAIFEATTTPWLHIVFLFETLFLFLSSVAILLSTQNVRSGLVWRDSTARQRYEKQEQMAQIGRASVQQQQPASPFNTPDVVVVGSNTTTASSSQLTANQLWSATTTKKA